MFAALPTLKEPHLFLQMRNTKLFGVEVVREVVQTVEELLVVFPLLTSALIESCALILPKNCLSCLKDCKTAQTATVSQQSDVKSSVVIQITLYRILDYS